MKFMDVTISEINKYSHANEMYKQGIRGKARRASLLLQRRYKKCGNNIRRSDKKFITIWQSVSVLQLTRFRGSNGCATNTNVRLIKLHFAYGFRLVPVRDSTRERRGSFRWQTISRIDLPSSTDPTPASLQRLYDNAPTTLQQCFRVVPRARHFRFPKIARKFASRMYGKFLIAFELLASDTRFSFCFYA